jgi:hypothetical protein
MPGNTANFGKEPKTLHMKKIYLALFSFLLLFTACKKDKPDDAFANLLARKTWELYDYQYRTYVNPSLLEGDFNFSANGRLEYTDKSGHVYKGRWEHAFHNDTQKHSLYIDVTDPITGDRKSEFYNHIEFFDDHHFKAYVYVGFNENVFWYQEKR